MRAAFSALGLALSLSACGLPPDIVGPTDPRIESATDNGRLFAQSSSIDIRDGDELSKAAWSLNAAYDPDIYTSELAQGERREICFISGLNSLCRTVGIGDQADFVVTHGGVDYPTRIVGKYVPPMAVFDADYQAAHRDRVSVEVPEVYELLHVALALRSSALEENNPRVKDTPYYKDMIGHFGTMTTHPLVEALDREILRDFNNYFPLRMNGYAFEYNADGQIIRSKIYDRTDFEDSQTNALLPLIHHLQSFSDQSDFRSFYKHHNAIYQDHIRYFEDEVNVMRMMSWLKINFPEVRAYDGVKIIFSPLVAGNQSITWFESNGYKELLAHVDYPYSRTGIDDRLTPAGATLRRSEILFTELNHGFINPTAELSRVQIESAMGDRSLWITADTSADRGYPSKFAVFLEMMNWGLESLYIDDFSENLEDRGKLLARLDRYMVRGRGFPRFADFSAFLLELYRERSTGTTIADLYPQIIAWFAERRDAAQVQPAPN